MSNLLNLKFWFNLRAVPLTPFFNKALIGFTILSLVMFIAIKLLNKRNKNVLYTKIFQALINFSLTNLFVGVFLMFFNYEMVPFLSSRFWFLLWAIGILVWLYFIIKKLLVIPRIGKQIEENKEFKKYIPQRKA